MVYWVMNPSQQDERNVQGPLLLDFKSHDDTDSANSYSHRCQKMSTKVKNKCQGKLSNGIILLHDHSHHPVAYCSQDQPECHEVGADQTSCI